MQRMLTVLSAMTLTAFFASAALASPPPEGEKPKKEKKDKAEKKGKKGEKDKKTIAKDAFAAGKARFDEGDFQGALEQFTVANDTLPNPFVFLKIAECHEKLGNPLDAVAWLEKYLGEKPDAANAKDIQAKIDSLKATPGKVSATSVPEGASLVLDGEDTGQTTPAELEVAPGEHTLGFKLEGYAEDSKTFEMTTAGEQELSVELVKQGPTEMISEEYPEEEGVSTEEGEVAPPEEEKAGEEVAAPVNKGVWAAAGIAGVGIVAATVFGILALNKEADFEDAKDKGPKENETYDHFTNRLDDIKSKGKTFAIVCDVSWGVAAAATVAGIITYYVTRPKAKKETKVSNLTVAPIVTSTGAGAGVGFNY
jgi:tetratricopeptide (TPR) repeat protein